MTKSVIGVIAMGTAGLLAAGCATSIKARQVETPENTQLVSLESRVADLAARLEAMTHQQETLSEDVQKLSIQKEPRSNIQPASPKSALTTRQIQQALAKSGFYNGAIDGKAGPQTKQAVKDFQKANGLIPDGVIGSKTQAALQKHLEG